MEVFGVYPIFKGGKVINIYLLPDNDKYGLSSDGNIWSRCSGEWRKLNPFKGNKQGSLFVEISGELRSVKHLVRKMFGGPKIHVNVGIKNGRSKLSNYKVFTILNLRKQGWTHKRIAQKFNVHETAISLVLNGKRWGHLR